MRTLAESRISILLIDVPLGALFIIANFGGYLRHLVKNSEVTQPSLFHAVALITDLPKQILGSSSDILYRWMVVCFFGLWIYLAGVLILALVRRRAVLAASGVGGLIAGAFSVAILSWAALAIVTIALLAGRVFHFLFHICTAVALWIGHFLIWAAPVLLPIVVIGMGAIIWKALGAKTLTQIAAGCVLLYFLAAVVRWIIHRIILLVLTWLWDAMLFLLKWLLAGCGKRVWTTNYATY